MSSPKRPIITSTTTAPMISGSLLFGCLPPPEYPAKLSGFGTPVTLEAPCSAGFFFLLDCPIRSFIKFSSLT